MTTHDKPTGGTAWELDQAGEQMVEAMKMDDAEAVALAMRRFGEALRNVSMGVVGQVISPLSAQITVLSSQLEKRDHRDLVYRADLRDHLDRRFDNFANELDSFKAEARAAWEDNGARLGKLEIGQEALILRLIADEKRMDSKRERIEALEQQIKEMQGPALTAEQRQYYAEMFYRMVSWFAQQQGLDAPPA
jgi:hypothetical protein